MIEDRVGSLFDQKDLTHIAHQCNLFHSFGAGIAKEIKERFPYAYEVDKQTPYGDREKLGTCSLGADNSDNCIIFNLYCQDGIGGQDRQTNYAAMGKVLLHIEHFLLGYINTQQFKNFKLGIPYNLGCGLANGDWKVVRPIIESVFAKSPIKVVICRLP